MQEYLGSGNNNPLSTTLIISNKEVEDIFRTVKLLEDYRLLLNGVTKTVQNEVKERKGRFLVMLLGTLGASLLGNNLSGRGINRTSKGRGINSSAEGVIATI